MTRFLCMELMYEYVSGTLDPGREKDIENYLPKDREAQRELDRLKRALAYSQKAAQTQVTGTLHEALLSFEPQWQKQLRELTRWGSQRGWRLLPYIFIVATIAFGVAVTKPWETAELKEVTLAEQMKNPSDMPLPPAQPETNVAVPSVPPPVTGSPVADAVSTANVTQPQAPSPQAPKPAPIPRVAAPVAPPPAALKPAATSTATTAGTAAAATEPPAETEAAAQEDERLEAPPVAKGELRRAVGSSRVDLQACKLEYSIVSPK